MTAAWLLALGLGVVGLAAGRGRRWLSSEGALTAALLGLAILLGSGPAGCFLLVFFFVSSSLLTVFRSAYKPADGREHTSWDGSGGRSTRGRTGVQVLANGLVPAAVAVVGAAGGLAWTSAAVAGAIGAATADSWATELGTAVRGPTRLITTLVRVPPGTSGGVSLAGTGAGCVGAAAIGLLAGLLAPLWRVSAPGGAGPYALGPLAGAGLAGGITGMTVDSFLGATLEGRWPGVNNETVNLACCIVGAVVGGLAATLW